MLLNLKMKGVTQKNQSYEDITESIKIADEPLQGDTPSEQCGFAEMLASNLSLRLKQEYIESHIHRTGETTCDSRISNVRIQEIYESCVVKRIMEDRRISQRMLEVNVKIFRCFEKINPVGYKLTFAKWLSTANDVVLFPVSQKKRDWKLYVVPRNKHEFVNPSVIKDIIGLDHDPTAIVLSCSFLKSIATDLLPVSVQEERDYFFKHIASRIRGYRTNQANRFYPGQNGIYRIEKQVGISQIDTGMLDLKTRYYDAERWMHPGRSKCNTEPVSTFAKTSQTYDMPVACGLSGSVNFWVWTALIANVDLSEDEIRMFLLSAAVVLCADGGHTFKEVYASATLSAIYFHYYSRYSKNISLKAYCNTKYAKGLYNVTRNLNPIGNTPSTHMKRSAIGSAIYDKNSSMTKMPHQDSLKPNIEKEQTRENLEGFFGYRRKHLEFANFSTILDHIPGLQPHRIQSTRELIEYVSTLPLAEVSEQSKFPNSSGARKLRRKLYSEY